MGHMLIGKYLLWFIVELITFQLGTEAWVARGINSCPLRPQFKPCTCTEKNRGLDISCEGASSLEVLRQALETVSLTQGRQTVWYLKLRKNSMHTFPSVLLDGLDVVHLIVHQGNITSIDESAFYGLEHVLESLDFSQNGLSEVPSRALQSLSSLVSLNLNYNQIEYLGSGAFRGLTSLLWLSMYGNRIKILHDYAFAGVGGNLTKVNLGANLLNKIPSAALRNLTALQRLQLHENLITHISSYEFRGLKGADSLDVLSLALNKIEEIPSRAFANLRALNSLDLEGNLIFFIHQNAFQGIENTLEWLKLGDNRLEAVPRLALANLTRLRQLDLRGNNITLLSRDCLKGYTSNIKFLYLQKNRIRTIEHGSFDDLESLEWLYLQSNQLTTMSYEIFAPLLDTLQVLDLHDNPFVCDCQVIWFRDWINERKSTEGVNLPRETKCSQPTSSSSNQAGSKSVHTSSSSSLSSSDSALLMEADDELNERIPISEVTLACSGAMSQTTSPPFIHIFASKMSYKIFLYLNILYSILFYIVFTSSGSPAPIPSGPTSVALSTRTGAAVARKLVRTSAVPALLMVRLTRRVGKRTPPRRRRREAPPSGSNLPTQSPLHHSSSSSVNSSTSHDQISLDWRDGPPSAVQIPSTSSPSLTIAAFNHNGSSLISSGGVDGSHSPKLTSRSLLPIETCC